MKEGCVPELPGILGGIGARDEAFSELGLERCLAGVGSDFDVCK
jgi:hypothetical protein